MEKSSQETMKLQNAMAHFQHFMETDLEIDFISTAGIDTKETTWFKIVVIFDLVICWS